MYLYIFEDGTAKKSEEAPTKKDLDAIEAGILQVLFCDGATMIEDIDFDGSMMEIDSIYEMDGYHS